MSFALQSCNTNHAFVLQHIFKLLQNFHAALFMGSAGAFLYVW